MTKTITETKAEPIKNKYDFIALYDIHEGNPNGDPDNNNCPRMDTATGRGYVTDGCIKRKIRDYIYQEKCGEPGWALSIKKGVPLHSVCRDALIRNGIDDDTADNLLTGDKKKFKAEKKNRPDLDRDIHDFLCRNYFDIRWFGAVLSAFTKGTMLCGGITGPIQIGISKSIDPIDPMELAITRVTPTKMDDDKLTDMGSKWIIPYGLYFMQGSIDPHQAAKTGFSEEDLDIFLPALVNMFNVDKTSSRSCMTMQKLIVFKHDNMLGHACGTFITDCVQVKRKDQSREARDFRDYEVTIDTSGLGKRANGIDVIDVDMQKYTGRHDEDPV